MVELGVFDGEEEHRPGPELERDVDLLFELSVNLERLLQRVVDPRRRLGKEEAAVAAGGSGADSAGVEDDDARPGVGQEPRGSATREACADDDDVGVRQVPGVSVPPRRLRQNMSAPKPAPTPASVAAAMPPLLPVTAWRAFRLANGLPRVRTSHPMNALRLLNTSPPS
jgi:hypothetical protein